MPELRLPHSEEAEQAVLAGIMYDNRGMERVPFLRPDHFSITAHRRIFETMQRMIAEKGQVADPVTMKDLLANDPDVTAAGGYRYLVQIVASAPPVIHLDGYGRMIFDHAGKRDAITAAQKVIQDATNEDLDVDAPGIARAAADSFAAIADGSGMEERQTRWSGQETASATLRALSKAMSSGGQLTGVTTGIKDIDAIAGGGQPGHLIIIAARPGIGKTGLATSIAKGAAMADRPGAYISLEMPATQLGARFFSDLSRMDGPPIPHENILKGKITEDEYFRILDMQKIVEAWPIAILDKSAQTMSEIAMEARSLKRRGKLDWLIVDYLQLIEAPRGRQTENRTQEVSQITRSLKALANELGIPVYALSQLSRQVESREDKRPILPDLRESGSIEQDADMVWFLYREHYYLSQATPMQRPGEDATKFYDREQAHGERLSMTEGVGDLIVAKNRHGSTRTIKLAWDGPRSAWGDHYPGREA